MSQAHLDRTTKEAIGLLSIGTFLEYFDLMLFVHMGVLLNEIFFPRTDPKTAGLIAAFTFCSTYIFRPFGALFFGWLGDTMGRKPVVIITTLLMSISCGIVACCPTYDQIGFSASVIIILCRIVQGMAAASERTGAEIYLTEIIAPPKQYPIVTLMSGFSALGTTAALAVSSFILATGNNWRYVFLIGGAVALVGSIGRLRLKETADFVNYKKQAENFLKKSNCTSEETKAVLDYPIFKQKVAIKTTLAFFLIECGWPVLLYFIYIYCATILKNSFNYNPNQIIDHNLIISICGLIKGIIILPLLSYYIHPLKILKWNVIIFSIFIISTPWLLGMVRSPLDILLIQSFIVTFALGGAPALAIFFKHFPVNIRFTYGAMIYVLPRSLMTIITSFGMVYLVDLFGYNGFLIIMLPVLAGYIFGLNHFIKLEKEVAN